jgi:hypothetical protein
MENLKLEHKSGQWMDFIVSSKVSLKAELLHSENMFPSVPLVQAVHTKNTRVPSGFAAKNTQLRTTVEYTCSPKRYSNTDCAARWVH